ncbi:DUF4145 domain-containing protein [Sphingomonas sp. EC-HK361]|uniref:DUF4145 domain-containing protein n=1 Tax=Sphingomonas sp. EC-HK361 TaxID=2038397 RepID=UPI001F480273|nr:DUF4145 domain-containing protein [Sphingomonas sp. EC-HK361]
MASVLAICAVCNRGLILKLCLQNPDFAFPNLCAFSVDFDVLFPNPFEIYPAATSYAPDNVPANIQSFFLQGVESYRSQRWDAAGSMFRKTLDIATKALFPSERSSTLYKRITSMVGSGLLTSAMGDWSHEIRLDGNEAVHDDEPETEADALAALKFTEAFLTYSFTLPAMVEANRAKRESTKVA